MILFFVISSCYAQKDNNTNSDLSNNSISYNRLEILKKIASKLNELDEKYVLNHPRKYSVVNDSFYNFFVYDLVDTTNVVPKKNDIRIEFIDKHIYHIASLNNYFKTSILLIVLDGELYFFEGVNCINSLNKIEDVIEFVNKNNELQYSELVKNRIVNYRKYDQSYTLDTMGKIPKCECK